MTGADVGARAEVGTELPTVEFTATVATSVRYAGASGDFNPLHYDPDVAGEISPTGGVIAHGMVSMGLASRVLTAWVGGPERVAELRVRFTKPWPLGETARFGGTVVEADASSATVEVWGRLVDGDVVIVRGRGTLRW